MERDHVMVLCTLIHVYALHIPAVQSCHAGQRIEGIEQTPQRQVVNPGDDVTITCKIGEQYNVNRTYLEKNCRIVAVIEEDKMSNDFTVTVKNVLEDGAYYCVAVLQNRTEISGAGTYLSLPETVTHTQAIIIGVAVGGGLICLICVAIYFIYKYLKRLKKAKDHGSSAKPKRENGEEPEEPGVSKPLTTPETQVEN